MSHTDGEKSNLAEEKLPYWNYNIPKDRWTEECPAFLVGGDAADAAQLATRDEDYQLMSWEDVQDIIRNNRLEVFKRTPSDLRRYRAYLAKVKKSHGSVMNLILKDRVRWDDLTPKGNPFEFPEDMRILYNDWPYGLDPAIVHIVVWTKFGCEEDPTTGDLTAKSRKQIDDYVTTTFRQHLKPDSVMWFKNWAALKSIHAVEHFHVMLNNPDPTVIRHITDGGEPMANKLSNEELYDWKPI